MALPVVIIDHKTGEPVATEASSCGKLLLTESPRMLHSVFKGTKFTAQTAGTKVATPVSGGSIGLTDILITFEKKNTSTVELRFNDGTNTETVTFSTLTDAPVNLDISLQGIWKGWKDAALEVVIANADAIGAVSVGYCHCEPEYTIDYDTWVNKRDGKYF